MSTPELETERLILRRIGAGDAELQHRVLNSPELMHHLGGPKSLEQIKEKHDKTQELYDKCGFGFLFMIEKETGELVGQCGMKLVDNPLARNLGDHEIGWIVREDRWRRGYAHEAMREILRWAFDKHQAPLVVAMTADANAPSWRLMERLGMERAQDLDFDDPAYPPEDNPTIFYRLHRSAWVAAG